MAKTRSRKPKKIYISVDFEGAACVIGIAGKPMEPLGSGWDTTAPTFKMAQRLVTAETNAAIRGALAGGATEVIVDDCHGCGQNLLYEELHAEAKVLLGTPRPRRFCPLDQDFAGIIFLCYHPMAGTDGGVLAHSYSSASVHRMLLNRKPIGEIGFDAAYAGELGVPVLFVSSDEAGCAEAHALLGRDLMTVATKKGLGRNCALSLSPKKAQDLTEVGVKHAVLNAHARNPLRMKGPFELTRVFKWETQAEAAASGVGAERLDPYTVRWRAKTIAELINH
jgi:D-amino peptidase